MTYFEETLGRPPGRADDPIREGVKAGTTLVGTPDTVSKGIERLINLSAGGFGGCSSAPTSGRAARTPSRATSSSRAT